MEIGKRYYVILHAYHHFVGEVVAVYGPRSARFTKLVRVHSCRRNWTDFFRDGFKDDTIYHHFPDGDQHGWLAAFDWDHPIPGAPRGRSR